MAQENLSLDSLLYSAKVDYTSLPRRLDEILASGTPEITCKLLVSEEPLLNLISDESESYRANFKAIVRHDQSLSGHLNGLFGKTSVERIEGKICILRHSNDSKVWLLVTDGNREFLKKPVRYFLRSIFPKLTTPLLSTSQIEKVLSGIETTQRVSHLRVTQIGLRGKIGSDEATREIESDRRWTDRSFKEVLDASKEIGQWITDIRLDYLNARGHKSSLRINRQDEFTFRGSVKDIFHFVMNDCADYGRKQHDFLKDRQRRPQSNFRSSPFLIQYAYPALNSIEALENLTGVIKGIESTSLTRLLQTESLLHEVVVDYRDGSTYEVLVLEPTSIIVIPQGRSTIASLQKFYRAVFSKFAEGVLKEIK